MPRSRRQQQQQSRREQRRGSPEPALEALIARAGSAGAEVKRGPGAPRRSRPLRAAALGLRPGLRRSRRSPRPRPGPPQGRRAPTPPQAAAGPPSAARRRHAGRRLSAPAAGAPTRRVSPSSAHR